MPMPKRWGDCVKGYIQRGPLIIIRPWQGREQLFSHFKESCELAIVILNFTETAYQLPP